MKFIIVMALCALSVPFLAGAWQAVGSRKNRKQTLKRAKAAAMAFTLGVRAVLEIPAKLWQRAKAPCFANIAEGVHQESVTKFADAAITTRHLLYTQGTDVNHIAVCGVSDIPLGTVADEVATADLEAVPVTVDLLGKGATKRMVADAAISANVLLYVGATGKVSASGTQIIGVSRTASAADGDVIEVSDGLPLSATPGVAASLYDANTILYATTDNTPVALAVAASRWIGRLASGNIVAATITEVLTDLGGNSAPTGTGVIVRATSPTLVTPIIGVATGTSLAATGLITTSSPSAAFGYATGAQGTAVAQATDRTTGVTCSGNCGKITTQATSLAAQESVTFTVTNASVAATDTVVVNIRSGSTGTKTIAFVNTVAAGSFKITLFNTDASVADTGASIINFSILKAVDGV